MPKGETTHEGQTFADRLREIIAARNETQASVATGIGVSPQAVGKWVSGGKIDDENLKTLGGYLKVNWLWLRYGEEAVLELSRWATERQPKVESTVEWCKCDALLEKIGVGVWEIDLLSGSVTLRGPSLNFFSSPPASLPELRLAIVDSYVPRFDAFVARVARSTAFEPPIAIEIKTKCANQELSVWGRNTGDRNALRIGGLMQDHGNLPMSTTVTFSCDL